MLILETKLVSGVDTKGIEIAAQRALLKTAQAIQASEMALMQRVFDRPTRWTLGAIKVKPTARFAVSVGILDPDGYYKRAQSYLGTQVTGGQRRIKAFEAALQKRGLMPPSWMAVPGAGAEWDAYGNMSAGQIRQVLSWFDAAERWSGSTQNMGEAGRAKRRKGTRTKRGFEYFVVLPGRDNYGRHRLHPGIYKRVSFVFGKAIKPVLIYVNKTSYQPRFDFEQEAINTFEREMPVQFEAALQRDGDA